jgi:hypothetical protein
MTRFFTSERFQLGRSQPVCGEVRGRVLLLLFTTTLTVGSSSCIRTQGSELKFGINPTRTGFVPAQIALAPCIIWPDRSTKIKGLPPTNRPISETTVLCRELSKYMTDGFDNQPFMKGSTQKLTEKQFLVSKPVLSLADSIGQEWKALSSDCQTCESLPLFYDSSIKTRQSWQLWLNAFSVSTKGADAILIPFLLSLNTRAGDDRGMLQAIRSGAVAMLLIDTNDGSLIWSGGRETEVVNRALSNTTTIAQLKMPPPEDLQRRLMTDALWLEFPGRQIYR